MANLNKETKSNRLLQSLRYTIAIGDGQEAFTNVLDLNATEIYTQEFLIPTSSLPYSQSSQDGEIVSSSIADPSYSPEVSILKYYWRLELTPSTIVTDGKSQTWFTLSPPQTNVNPQLVNSNQLTNWVSNKYYDPAFPTRNTEGNDPGYRIIILSGSSGGTAANAEPIDGTLYQFDYKTGVLNFYSSSQSPSEGDKLYITAYRYIGQTLDTFISEGGGGGGTPGTSGTSGTTGTSGTSGTSGTTGTSGTSGTTGTSGTSGTSGTTGTSGTSGTTGTSGTSGTTGTSGTSGTTGTSGTSGTTGTSGTSGTTGTSGTSGTTGTSGTSGTTGTSGTSGTTGTSGTSGTTGTSGTSGTTGTSGTSGTTGTSGTSGTTGTSGTSGTTGTSGTSGTTGTSGTSGTTGTSGTSGTTGTSGTSGTTGTSGTSGTTGTSGTSGTTGTSGTSGTSISLTVVSGSIEGTGIERLEISGSGNLIVNSSTASINIEGGGNTTQYQTSSGTLYDLGTLNILDYDSNVFVTSDPNTGKLTLQFGTPSLPSITSITDNSTFNVNRFNKINDNYTVDMNFDLNTTTFISASFISNSIEILGTDIETNPFELDVTNLAYPSLASGSHLITGSLTVQLADNSEYIIESTLNLNLSKGAPGNPSLTANYSGVQGGGSTNSSNLRVHVGATGSITYTSSSGTANDWESVSITNNNSSPVSLAGGVNTPSIGLTQNWQSPAGENDPQIFYETNRTYTVDRVFTYRWGAAAADSLSQANILDLYYLASEGFNSSSVTTEDPLNVNLTIQGNSFDYHYIIVKSNEISDTPTITVNNLPVTFPLVATYTNIVGSEGYKVFRTGQQGPSAITYKITSS